MNELSLFTGSGGGLLATHHLLGWKTIGYVEFDDYCQRILAQRIKDGYLDNAPIFTDIRAFNREGYAKAYQGMVDIVSGGFPCQDLSCAGKGEGITGGRSGLWFEMAETVRIVRPRFVFIENVPTLLVRGFKHVLSALSEMGFDAEWGIVSAADVGAPHLRKRLWIVAYSECVRWWESAGNIDSARESFCATKREKSASRIGPSRKIMANTPRIQSRRKKQRTIGERTREGCKSIDPYSNKLNDDTIGFRTGSLLRGKWQSSELQKLRWWGSEPGLGRVADGVAHRVDRLKAIGNGQVPAVAATAWEILAG